MGLLPRGRRCCASGLSGPPPHHIGCRPHRRRHEPEARRGVPGPPRGAVSGRVAGVQADTLEVLRQPLEEAGSPSPGLRAPHLPGPLHAGGGYEPLPLRLLRRPRRPCTCTPARSTATARGFPDRSSTASTSRCRCRRCASRSWPGPPTGRRARGSCGLGCKGPGNPGGPLHPGEDRRQRLHDPEAIEGFVLDRRDPAAARGGHGEAGPVGPGLLPHLKIARTIADLGGGGPVAGACGGGDTVSDDG